MSKLGAKRGPYRTFAGRPSRSAEVKILIEAHGDSDACLEWKHKINQHGYGVCSHAGRDWRVHRLAYVLTNGGIDPKICVLHKCDNPPCFNPRHLFLGTRTDNQADMIAKGRGSHGINPNPPRGIPRPDLWGEKNKNSKLTAEKVLQILKYLDMGCTQQEIAKEFRINQTLVSAIKRGKIWKHLSCGFVSMNQRN